MQERSGGSWKTIAGSSPLAPYDAHDQLPVLHEALHEIDLHAHVAGVTTVSAGSGKEGREKERRLRFMKCEVQQLL